VAYAAATAATLGLRCGLVTRAAATAPAAVAAGCAAHVVTGWQTTTFGIRYGAEGERQLRVLARAPDMRPDDIPGPWRRVGVLHVAPVLAEVGAEAVQDVVADFVGVTAQGWLRRTDHRGRVRATAGPVPEGLLSRADAVVVSDEDLAAWSDWRQVLPGRVRLLVVTLGERGAVAYAGGRALWQPGFAARLTDATGAGDSAAAALFVALWQGLDLEAALRFAMAAGAFAVETRGPRGVPGRQAVLERARWGARVPPPD